ncbi:hypothetical protein SAMN05421812_10141 [Asanoa hainanensis]|uniref:Uncharacterized protein n=1 Tax=Asanoa hainanensis TaxID=560556 RepID=A0A239FRD5_9ACTN|nr:hypothetical protein SAMN05421812_10141 [Asanoa hainanensis]
MSRRAVLGAGVGVAAAVGGLGSPAVARRGGERLGRVPVSMSMHTHSSFSEGGSWADGGGGASMLAQLEQAKQTGTDVVWWTDHDWRMEAYGYYDGIRFDGTDEGQQLAWVPQNEGPVTDARHAFVDEPHSPDEPGKALRVTATGTSAAEWGAAWLFADGGNSFYTTNLTDTTLFVDVLAERIGPDAEVVVQLETSYRPATAGRPAGVYVLEYRVGGQASRTLRGELTGVVTVPATGGWQTLKIRPRKDIHTFWPEIMAEDSALARLRFGVRARNNATGQGVFDHLRIKRTRDQTRWAVREQRDLMKRLGRRYRGITQLLGSEVSMVRHLNVYMEHFELFPYADRGVAPVLDDSVAAAREMVRWYHQRGALVQYNHPPIDAAELVASRALGCDLMETVDPGGVSTITRQRLDLFDVAARNALFLTATSRNDDHAGRDWTTKDLFQTSAWSRSRRARDLIAALAAGHVFLNHQRLWRDGALDLLVDGRRAMGQVIRTDAAYAPVEIFADHLPVGARVDVVVGVCDRGGATSRSIERQPFPATAFAGGEALPFRLDRASGRYLRVEAYAADETPLGFSNPVWLLPDDDTIEVPNARRFELRH